MSASVPRIVIRTAAVDVIYKTPHARIVGQIVMASVAAKSAKDLKARADAAHQDDKTFDFILAHVGRNLNCDNVSYDEMKAAAQTIVGRKIDIQHDQYILANIGKVLSAKFVDAGDVSYIECTGELWTSWKPEAFDVYMQMVKEIVCLISMEMTMQEGVCSICGHIQTTNDDLCDHIANHLGETINGVVVERFCKGINYSGVGVLSEDAADPGAEILSVAEIATGKETKSTEGDASMAVNATAKKPPKPKSEEETVPPATETAPAEGETTPEAPEAEAASAPTGEEAETAPEAEAAAPPAPAPAPAPPAAAPPAQPTPPPPPAPVPALPAADTASMNEVQLRALTLEYQTMIQGLQNDLNSARNDNWRLESRAWNAEWKLRQINIAQLMDEMRAKGFFTTPGKEQEQLNKFMGMGDAELAASRIILDLSPLSGAQTGAAEAPSEEAPTSQAAKAQAAINVHPRASEVPDNPNPDGDIFGDILKAHAAVFPSKKP